MIKAILELSSWAVLMAPLLAASPQKFWVQGSDPGGYLGVTIREVTAKDVSELGLPGERGVVIAGVEDDGPGTEAGLAVGDVVLEYEGVAVLSVRQFQRLVGETPPGRHVTLRVWRSGTALNLTAEIGQRSSGAWTVPNWVEIPRTPEFDLFVDPESLGQSFFVHRQRPRLGISGAALGEQMAKFLGIPGRKGVLVMEVVEASPAEKAGLTAGDVITQVDGETVEDLSQLRSRLSEDEVSLEVLREGTPLSLRVVLKPQETEKRDAGRL